MADLKKQMHLPEKVVPVRVRPSFL